MNAHDDGGPAFPTPAEQFLDGPQGRQPASAWGMEGKPGMSLRDWFAGQVISGMVHMTCCDNRDPRCAHWQVISEAAYLAADAMLAARKEQA